MCDGMPSLPRLNEEMVNEIFFSNFLKVVLPFAITMIVFMIIRMLFRRALWDMPKIKAIVDAVLVLIFLLVCVVFVWPLVRYLIETNDIPDGDVFVNEDGTPYEYHDPTEWFDVASNVEFHDPFDPENWPDAVSSAEGKDSFSSSDSSDAVSSAPYDYDELREELEEGLKERNKNIEYKDWHLFDPYDYDFNPAGTDYSYDPMNDFDTPTRSGDYDASLTE